MAGLALRRSPSLAWFSVAVAAALASVDLAAQVRAQLVGTPSTAWAPFVALSAIAATIATVIGGDVVLRAWRALGGERGRTLRGLACAIPVIAHAVAQMAAFFQALSPGSLAALPDPLASLKLANRLLLGVLAWELLLVLALLVGPRARRAWSRSHRLAPEGAGAAAGHSSFLAALADEFVPGMRSRADLAAASERERLAADLHARVVPELRRAAAAAPSDGAAASGGVRGALDDIETLMAERHSVVLEEFGLLAALEWLAERTEARGQTSVELEVDGEVDMGRPPRDVERAAFRVAMLAIENAARHAPAAPIAISVGVMSREVHLAIADAGPGIDQAAAEAARRDGHRGLADMEAAASSVGASLSVARREDGVGTRVLLTWAAR